MKGFIAASGSAFPQKILSAVTSFPEAVAKERPKIRI
jgi:hypothetical protein